MSDGVSFSHAKTSLRYHIIFSTKYRKRCLSEVRDVVFESFRYAEGLSDFKILIMNLESDHIHFLVTFKPALSISQVARRMKQISTDFLWKANEAHFKKYFWRGRQIWTGGYFVSTIGEVSEAKILEYIKSQG